MKKKPKKFKIEISYFSNLLFFSQKKIENNMDILFFGKNKNKILEQIKKTIGKQKTKLLEKNIKKIKPIFSNHWEKISKELFLWKQYFQKNEPLFHQAILDVMKLSGLKYFDLSKIPIYLIYNPHNKDKKISAWFSWTLQKSFIVIEIPPNLKISNNLFPLSILVHEFSHLMIRKNKNIFSKINKISEEKENKKLFSKLSNGMPSRIFLEELLISSFIPEGYLSQKHFHIKIIHRAVKPRNLLAWRRFIAYKFCHIAKKYINSAQRIDEKYLRDLIDIIKQNAK